MAILADHIPRYAAPTQDELDDMYGELKSIEVMEQCRHSAACLRVLEMACKSGMSGVDSHWGDEAANWLGCDECEEYE